MNQYCTPPLTALDAWPFYLDAVWYTSAHMAHVHCYTLTTKSNHMCRLRLQVRRQTTMTGQTSTLTLQLTH